MKTLCMDTSHRYLVLALIEDGKVVASHMQEAWKKQSETIFVELIALMEEAKWQVQRLTKAYRAEWSTRRSSKLRSIAY